MSEYRSTTAEIERARKLALAFLRRRPWLASYCCADDLMQEACLALYSTSVQHKYQALLRQLYRAAARMLPGSVADDDIRLLERAYRNGGLADDDVEAAVELGWLQRSQTEDWRIRLDAWRREPCRWRTQTFQQWQRRRLRMARVRAWLRGDPCGLVPDVPLPDAADRLEKGERLRAEIAGLLAELKPREAQVLCLVYGLDGDEALTEAEIGRRLGMTRERVSQIHAMGMRKLRHPMRSRRLRGYLVGYDIPGHQAPASTRSVV